MVYLVGNGKGKTLVDCDWKKRKRNWKMKKKRKMKRTKRIQRRNGKKVRGCPQQRGDLAVD